MPKLTRTLALFLVLIYAAQLHADEKLANELQAISVTVKIKDWDGRHRVNGSGTVITTRHKGKNGKLASINFILTAQHVIDELRREYTEQTSTGNRKIVEYEDCWISQTLTGKDGIAKESKDWRCMVVSVSDAWKEHDLALLVVRKRGFTKKSAKFFIEGDSIPPLAANVYHVGSMAGEHGANSITDGIISKVGRLFDIGELLTNYPNENKRLFDQITSPATGGSSGGGVFFKDGKHRGEYLGMVTIGVTSGHAIHWSIPTRRIRQWAKEKSLEWLLDPSKETPALDKLKLIPLE